MLQSVRPTTAFYLYVLALSGEFSVDCRKAAAAAATNSNHHCLLLTHIARQLYHNWMYYLRCGISTAQPASPNRVRFIRLMPARILNSISFIAYNHRYISHDQRYSFVLVCALSPLRNDHATSSRLVGLGNCSRGRETSFLSSRLLLSPLCSVQQAAASTTIASFSYLH